jgi:hypothetical protein
MTTKDREDIQKYFEANLEDLRPEDYKKILKQLRAKYHPDNFEKFEDETIREMATERFQRIEALASMIDAHFNGNTPAPKAASVPNDSAIFSDLAIFAANKLKVELITSDKDLKYHLFGTRYRWLTYGDRYQIPNTTGTLVIDGNHQGSRIGFNETIRMYLAFDEQASVDAIAQWLFSSLEGQQVKLIIEGNVTEVSSLAIQQAIRKASFLRLEMPA